LKLFLKKLIKGFSARVPTISKSAQNFSSFDIHNILFERKYFLGSSNIYVDFECVFLKTNPWKTFFVNIYKTIIVWHTWRIKHRNPPICSGWYSWL